MRSSFASFNTGLLGMRASQYALDITGHNISNINTTGYTRQRTDQYSMALTGGGVNNWDSRIGMGVMVSGISQIRDPYLDVRFRNEVCQVGYSDSTLAGLEDLQSILDEVGLDAGIMDQFTKISSHIKDLAKEITPGNENLLRSAMDSLTKFINQYAKKVELAQTETEKNFQEGDIPQVNDILQQIRDLNVSIETNNANGNPALELLDRRNVLIDQLSNFMKIEVNYTPKSVAGTDRKIDELNINFIQDDGKKIPIIQGQGHAGKFDSKILETKDPDTQAVIDKKMTVSLTPSIPMLDTDALGGYPGLANQGDIDTVKGLLDVIAGFNDQTSALQGDIDDNATVMNTAYDELKKAKAALKADPTNQDLKDAVTDATDTYNDAKDTWNESKTKLAEKQKERLPKLTALQKWLPEARFKEEADGNLTVTYSKNDKNFTLVKEGTTAEFSLSTVSTPPDGKRQELLLKGVGDTAVEGTPIAKYPAIASDKVSDVNAVLKKMQELEVKIKATDPTAPEYAALEAERAANLIELKGLMPNANLEEKQPTGNPPSEYTVSLVQDGKPYALINGTTSPGQFKIANNALKLDQANPPAPSQEITDLMSDGSLKGTMELLNCDGSFDADTSNPRGYGYYTKMLDSLAIGMSEAFNEANKVVKDKDGNFILDDKGNKIGGDLFGKSDDEPLSAKNICIAEDWANGNHGIVATRNLVDGKPADTGKNENILHLQNLIDNNKTVFLKDPKGSPDNPNDVAFTGTFFDCYKNMSSMLGTDIKMNKSILDNHLSVAEDISNNIDSVSAVSLDEEGVNMLRYQKSLTAAMRFMTTIDEALNAVINNMGLVGR